MKRKLYITFVVVSIAVCFITLLAAYGGMFNPARFYALPAMVSMTFPVWMIVTPLLFIATLFIKRRLAWLEAVTMVLCIGPFLDFCPLNLTREQPDNDPGFSLLTYNVYHGTDYLDREITEDNPTVTAILQTDADVVCMQEIMLIRANPSINFTDEQVDSLNSRYPYQAVSSKGEAVLSKYPIMESYERDLGSETASLQFVKLNIMGEVVDIYNVHLQSIGLTPEDKEVYMELTRGNPDDNLRRAKTDIMTKLYHAFKNRANQGNLLREIILDSPAENIIVCGDFNDIAGCYAMRRIESAGLKNAYSNAGFGPSCTYRANRFYFHIDQVLYNSGLQPTEIKTLSQTGISDHLPVFTEFEFR